MLIVVTEISRSVPKIVIPGFRPKHFTITFAGPRNVGRYTGVPCTVHLFRINSATTQVRTLVGNLTNYFQVLFKKVG